MASTRTPPRRSNKGSGWTSVFPVLSEVMNRVGVVGFIVLFYSVFIWVWASLEQKQALIDRWFLLRSGEDQHFYIIIGILLILLAVQQLHYTNVLRQNQQRIDTVADAKRELQSKGLKGKRLRSSNKD